MSNETWVQIIIWFLTNLFVFKSSLNVENSCVADYVSGNCDKKKSGFLKVFGNLLSLLSLQIKSYWAQCNGILKNLVCKQQPKTPFCEQRVLL